MQSGAHDTQFIVQRLDNGKAPGHNGIPGNEAANELAKAAEGKI